MGNELRVMGSEMRATSNRRRPTRVDLRAAVVGRLSVVRATGSERRVPGDERRATSVATSEMARAAGSNKPMVPTAPGALTEPARRSRRRHIGEPLDSSGQPVSGSAHWILD